ncbi:Helix-turn-helix domain protein [Caprobacter fermentans]|uniref:Helix-turn-helix domain protein n=1 Tax=Caproicibacter fermentans TaxID=2576756 RepID=A0A6N8HZN7_9FIRM|nr:helix-turn-helix transcriptional regulator [Caproicibacter fermentans]MVB11055.1 Helix-turn-helix domain protein [Caproicibacter fermentans]
MQSEYRNIYQIARESAGITQEKAAELVDVSVESLRAYESGRRYPPNDAVIRMIEVYGTQYLAYQHLRNSAEIGRQILPEIELKDLPAAFLNVLNEVNAFLKERDRMIDITCDGIISEAERPEWDRIMQEMDRLSASIMALKYARTKPDEKTGK